MSYFDANNNPPSSSSGAKMSRSLEDGDQQTSERQLIDSRIHLLLKCLQEVEVLRGDTDILRKRIKENLNQQSFEPVQTKLKHLENQIFSRLDKKLFRSQIDMPLNSLEYEMHQLINNLSSASMFNRRDQFSILSNTDYLIKQMLTRMSDIERYKQAQENMVKMNKFSELNENLNLVLDKMRKLLDEESPKLIQAVETKSASQEMNSSKLNDIKQWLLVSSNAPGSPAQSSFCCGSQREREDDKNSFDFVDMNSELESIEVIADFDESSHDYRYWLLDRENPTNVSKRLKTTNTAAAESSPSSQKPSKIEKQSNSQKPPTSDDGFSRTFDEISSKPINYWLLK